MTRKENSQKNYLRKRFGAYITRLREEKKVSIRRVAEETKISDPFLYQIEKGEKSLTDPEFFNVLANYYGVKVEELLKQAGYLPMHDQEKEIEMAIKKIITDKDYKLSTVFWSKLSEDEKLEIIVLYEEATGKKVISEGAKIFR